MFIAGVFIFADARAAKKSAEAADGVRNTDSGNVALSPVPVSTASDAAEKVKVQIAGKVLSNPVQKYTWQDEKNADVDDSASEAARPFISADSNTARKKSVEPDIFKKLRNSKSEKIPPEVKKLADEITQNCTNDMQKARAIYDWLTENIKYDSEEWRNIVSGADSYTHDHSPSAVLERGTTVCIGYAWLFDSMCASAGLESTFLIGDVRGYRGTDDDELVSRIKHAWSAVKIDGEWGLLDATWGAVQEGETKEEAAGRADYYFLTPPSQMVFDHLPESDEWQLLDEPVAQETAFSVLPNLKPSFFQNELKLGTGYTSNLKAVSGKNGRMLLTAPEGVDVMATVCSESDSAKTFQVPVFRHGEAVAVDVPGQSAGARTILRIYSRSGESQPFTCSADFLIISE